MQQLERVRRRFWTYKQPITHIPTQEAVPISDLFAWRNSSDWETYFELYNIPALLDGETRGRQSVQLTLFDQNGCLIKNHFLNVDNGKRITIGLKSFLENHYGEFGTFAVFHLDYPSSISELGCFVAERGHLSYRYKNSLLRSYVQGNLDAIARLEDGNLELLGASSFLKREICLQYVNQNLSSTELFLVNPTQISQRLECKYMNATDKRLLATIETEIPSGGIRCVSRNFVDEGSVYIFIKSRLVMARPLAFTYEGSKMDVFHG